MISKRREAARRARLRRSERMTMRSLSEALGHAVGGRLQAPSLEAAAERVLQPHRDRLEAEIRADLEYGR